MKLVPRDYQRFARDSIYRYFQEKGADAGNPVVVMPTGTGKSIVIADFLESVYQMFPNQRIMALTHVKELIEQNHSKLLAMWPSAPAGIYSAGLGKRDFVQKIIFAGIASVAKRADLFGHVDLLLIDEAHLVNPSEEGTYRAFIDALKAVNPNLKVIGFTATPWRLGHGKITEGGIFTDICCDMSGMDAFNWLIAQGYLVPLIPKRTKTKLEIDGVHMRGGEFIAGELQTAVNKKDTTEAAVKEAIELGADRQRWLVFCAGVEHAVDTAEMLNYYGIPTIAIHSKMTNKERDAAIDGLRSGKYRAATNNNVLTTGFDLPVIDLILMLRPTCSTVLWVQMLGRGTRPVYAPGFDLTTTEGRLAAIQASGKLNTLVLDYAGNSRRLGPINDPVVPRKKGEGGGEAPIRECEACGTYNHASARHCICCGAEFHIQTKLKMAASSADLIKGDLPIVEVFKVDHITCTRHDKLGKPPMMKVSYYCGLKSFDQFVCFEHDGFAGKKARDWWRSRSKEPVPETTEEGIERVSSITQATHLRVWVNKQYPEIMAECFDGTAFGQQEPDAPPTVQAHKQSRPISNARARRLEAGIGEGAQIPDDPDADIPFAITGGSVNTFQLDDDIPF